jgi:hypothetical protein
MAKATFRCLKDDSKVEVEFNVGERVKAPCCPECGEIMKRIFKVGKGQQTDDLIFNVSRMMTYHSSKN